MQLGFKPDFFSKSKIFWTKNIEKKISKIVIEIVKNYISDEKFVIKQHKGLEINSNNFKIKFKSKTIILKRWSKDMEFSQVKNVLNLMIWLNSSKLPVQSPQAFKNNKYFIKCKNQYWSYFKFVDGTHFKGNISEFSDVVKFIGKITKKLEKYPIKNFQKAPKYYSIEDNEILKRIDQKNINLNKIFGERYGRLIRQYLPEIKRLFKKFQKLNFKNKAHVCHIDIHPHNLITKNKKIQAFLDIDSCKVVDNSFAIAYALLKICKQTIIYNNKKNLKKKITSNFISKLKQSYKLNKKIQNNLYYFAISEVLRRLIYMFKLNIYFNDKKWNKIIPIQLGHIDECKIFFCKD